MIKFEEALQYNVTYSDSLNPKIFDENNKLYPEISDKIVDIVEEFIDYADIEDVKIMDIRLVGSNASYNYNDDSDLDIHIVTDLSKIANPETIARLYMDSVKKDFKRDFDIKIKGIDAEIYVEDIGSSATSNGVYSVFADEWVKFPERIEDPTPEQIAKAEEIESKLIELLSSADTADEIDSILDSIYLMRKDALASDGESAPANIAYKSLRNKGIINRARDELYDKISKELSI